MGALQRGVDPAVAVASKAHVSRGMSMHDALHHLIMENSDQLNSPVKYLPC